MKIALGQIGVQWVNDLPSSAPNLWRAQWEGTPQIDHRLVLQGLGLHFKIDLALIAEEIFLTPKRLVVFDMDSTLIAGEVIDELAKRAGKATEVREITRRAMNGELDFSSALRSRVAMLQGLPLTVLKEVESAIPLNAGVETCLKKLKAHGVLLAIATGGFDFFAHPLAHRLGVDFVYANQLEIQNGILTGHVKGEVIDGNMKAQILKKLCAQFQLNLMASVAVGDGANDLPMLKNAGLGVAFHAKEQVRRQSPCEIYQTDMTTLLSYMAIGG